MARVRNYERASETEKEILRYVTQGNVPKKVTDFSEPSAGLSSPEKKPFSLHPKASYKESAPKLHFVNCSVTINWK